MTGSATMATNAARHRAKPLRRVWQAMWVLLLASLSVGATAGAALADAKIEVRLVHATKGKDFVHAKLQDLSAHFKRMGTFTSFEPAGEQTLTLRLDETGKVKLPGGETLELTYRGTSKEFVKLRFELADMTMNVRIHDGGLFFHSGVAYQGGRIIVAIRARDLP